MPGQLESLPDKVLDDLMARLFALCPPTRTVSLACLGPRIRSSALRVLFHTLRVSDDSDTFASLISNVHPILANPSRYAHQVKRIHINDPDLLSLWYAKDHSRRGEETAIRPLDFVQLSTLLKLCTNLEEFTWESSLLPPDGLCELLMSQNHLNRFSYAPRSSIQSLAQSSRNSLLKWDGPSLPLLSSLPITSLVVTRLSQYGARALSTLLSNMGEFSSLEDVTVDFLWLDDHLCEAIVDAGRRIRRLKIGTTGTKLTDRGVSALIEGCDSLEEFTLEEVQGRLSRSLWRKASHYPAGLKQVTVAISEIGTHHSWMTDHLLSLDALPLHMLEALRIVRKEPPPRLVNGHPAYDKVSDDAVALKPVPQEFVDAVRRAKALKVFECDWWAWDIPDLKSVLESCNNLMTIKLCLNAPFSKMLNLTSPFATLAHLHTLSVSVNPIHAPGKPPVPLTPDSPSSSVSLPTPSESPALKPKSLLPQLLDFDQMQTHACLASASDAAAARADPSMPLLRDVKRFVKRCPKLETLHWYGNSGRGAWQITRPTAQPQAQKNPNITIEYSLPTISPEIWNIVTLQRELEEAYGSGFSLTVLERGGQAWANGLDQANGAPLQGKEKEKVGSNHGKKAKPSSVNTTWSPNESSSPCPSPRSFSQLTPPNSEASLSFMLLPVTQSASWPEDEEKVEAVPRSIMRKRTPSEPGPNSNARTNGRSRSATSTAPSGGGGSPTSPRLGTANTNGVAHCKGASKPGRGRGAAAGGKGDKHGGTSNAAPASSSRGGASSARGRGSTKRGAHASTSPATVPRVKPAA